VTSGIVEFVVSLSGRCRIFFFLAIVFRAARGIIHCSICRVSMVGVHTELSTHPPLISK